MYWTFREFVELKEHGLIDSGMEAKDGLNYFKETRVILLLAGKFYLHWE